MDDQRKVSRAKTHNGEVLKQELDAMQSVDDRERKSKGGHGNARGTNENDTVGLKERL